MNAKLIRTEKSEYGWTNYYYECVGCGKEYWLSIRSKRTCYCGDCLHKQQQEKSKIYNEIYRQRKQQEHTNEVLDKIRAEIKDTIQWYMDHGQEDCSQVLTYAIEIIDKYRKENKE